jgi:hypothetical protein
MSAYNSQSKMKIPAFFCKPYDLLIHLRSYEINLYFLNKTKLQGLQVFAKQFPAMLLQTDQSESRRSRMYFR